MRYFNFVQDTANAFLAALESDNGVGEVVNIGSNYEVSIADVANIINQSVINPFNSNLTAFTSGAPNYGVSTGGNTSGTTGLRWDTVACQ